MIPRRRPGLRFWHRPNAELSAFSLEVDLGAISLAEGLRAALGTATLVAINHWLHWRLLNYVALGAFFACLCDIGGAMKRRLVSIGSFAAGGMILFALMGIARAAGAWFVLPAAALVLFANAMGRSWGQNAMQVGNILSIVTILAIDRPANWRPALSTAAAFAIGALWAMLLTLVLWRLRPYQPARRAVAAVYRQIAALVLDLRTLALDPGVETQAWDDHAVAHRRSVRDSIELARAAVEQIFANRGPAAGSTVQSPIRLEAADQIFGVLIALSSVIETDPALRPCAARALRVIAPFLRTMADSIEHDQDPARPAITRAIARIEALAGCHPGLATLLHELAGRLTLAVSLAAPPEADMDPADAKLIDHPLLRQIRDRLHDQLTWSSPILRHATRTAVLGTLAIAYALFTHRYYSHWVSITLVVTLQPYFAVTRQRAIERVLGTSAGVIGAGILATLLHSQLAMAAALVPVTVAAFALRRVSFTLFISGLTPFVVLLVELGHAGAGTFAIALTRMIYTAIGGLLAVLGNRYLWPIWEPARLREAFVKALQTHAQWMLADKSDDQTRRIAGRASNELETTLARALSEPRRARDPHLERMLIADAALRRIGGHLTAIALQTRAQPPDPIWRGWTAGTLIALATNSRPPPRPSSAPPAALLPIVRQTELLAGAMREKSEQAFHAAKLGGV